MSNIKKAEKEIQEILGKYALILGYEISFPMYKILPDEVKLALSVLQRNSMKILVTIKAKEK